MERWQTPPKGGEPWDSMGVRSFLAIIRLFQETASFCGQKVSSLKLHRGALHLEILPGVGVCLIPFHKTFLRFETGCKVGNVLNKKLFCI